MSHGIAGYTAVMRLPMLLDLEPYLPQNKNTPRDAARLLVDRTLAAHPNLKPHVFFDSGFGSFTEMDHYLSLGVVTTMSLSSNQWDWLFDLLWHDCPLESGRTAAVILPETKQEVLASLYVTKSESGKVIDIRTLTSAFTWEKPVEGEVRVTRILGRQKGHGGLFEYETLWADGDKTWEPATAFMDTDGTFSVLWLEKAVTEDLVGALMTLSQAQLVEICDSKGFKVSLIY